MKSSRSTPWALRTAGLIATLAIGGCDTSYADSDRAVAAALDALDGNRTTEGVRLLEQAIQLAPDNARAHYTLGLVRLQQLHDPAGALASLDLAVEASPSSPETHYQCGVALSMLDRVSEARVAWERTVELDPQHGRALFRLALVSRDEGDVPLAIDFLTRAIWADPRFPLAYNELAAIYTRFGRPQEAIRVLENGIANENPDDADARAGRGQNRADLGRLHYELGAFELAVPLLEEAASLRPESGAIAFNLAVALRERAAQTDDPAHREQALTALRRARSRCNPATEQARCESIEAALADLEEAVGND